MGIVLFIVGSVQGFKGHRFWGMPLLITYIIFFILAAALWGLQFHTHSLEVSMGMALPFTGNEITEMTVRTVIFYVLALLFYAVGYGIFYAIWGRRKKGR